MAYWNDAAAVEAATATRPIPKETKFRYEQWEKGIRNLIYDSRHKSNHIYEDNTHEVKNR